MKQRKILQSLKVSTFHSNELLVSDDSVSSGYASFKIYIYQKDIPVLKISAGPFNFYCVLLIALDVMLFKIYVHTLLLYP